MNNLLNKIVIGTAQFGLDYGINNKTGKIPPEEVFKILDLMKQYEIDFVDTAQAYGNSENVLGLYQKEKSISFQTISKLHNCSPKEVKNLLQQSFERLHIDKLYGLLLHSFDTYINNPSVYNSVLSLKRDGLINKVGFSLYYLEQLQKILEDNIEVDLVQVPYNLFDRRFEKYFSELKKRKVEIHTRSIFLQGLFFMQPDELPQKLKEFSTYISRLKELSKKLKLTIHESALLFVVSNPLIDKAVVGIDNVNHLKDIISVLNDNNKYELINSGKHLFSELKIENETILIPSNWN